jgi:hypothetical protein
MASPRIEEAKRILKIADHMVYVTYPVINENRLLIKILAQINNVMSSVVLAVLENEYANKRIKSYADLKMNFQSFMESSKRYGLEKPHIESMKKVAALMELHSQSSMEFVKKGSFVIMSDSMHTEEITYPLVKSLLSAIKQILDSVENRLNLDSAQIR